MSARPELSPMGLAAVAYAEAGFFVVPLHGIVDGTCTCRAGGGCEAPGKHPRRSGWQKEATSNPETVAGWWRHWQEAANIGLRPLATDHAVVDVDGPAGEVALADLIGANALDGAPQARTARGRHLWVSAPGAQPVELGEELELKTENVVVPPSRNAVGTTRAWGSQRALLDVAPPPAPPELVRRRPAGTNRDAEGGGAPITQPGRNRALTSLAGSMRRRGMTETELLAAVRVVNAERCQPPLPEGDLQRIAKSVAGYAPAEDAPTSDAGSGGDDAAGTEPAEAAPDDWSPPLPASGAPLVELPAELFPPFLRAWIEALATAYQVPAGLPASMALSAFSTAVGGRWRVRVAADWYEELSIWMATVLPSGERKSPVVREAKAPVEDHERALALEASDRVAEAQAAHEVLLKRFEKAKGDAAKAPGEADRYAAEEQVSTLAVEVRRSRPPAFPRLLADDATPEALTSLLADHGGVMSVLSAEGGLIDTLAGRYSDGVANLDAVLKAHGGEQIRVDRKGRPPELVERPVLTLGLAVQPTVIEQARENRVLERRGFLARFLYLVPTTGLGHRELDPPPVPEAVRRDYARRLLRLLEAPTEPTELGSEGGRGVCVGSVGGVQVKELPLSPEARGALWIMRRDVERRLDPTTGDLFCVSAWANKLPGAVVRIAGLLHLAEHGPEGADRPISEEGMARAALIGGTLIEHAKAALGHGGPGGVPVEKLRALLAWVERQPNDRFSERDAFRGAGDNARFPDMGSFRPALAALERLGYVRRLEAPSPDAAGRPPSPEYAVNPLIGGAP